MARKIETKRKTGAKYPTKTERIRMIADLLADGSWESRKSASKFAPKWGVSPRTIEDDAVEAARLLIVSPSEMDAARARVAAMHDAIAHKAMRRGAYAPAIQALVQYAKLLGLEPAGEKPAEAVLPAHITIIAPPQEPPADTDSDEETPKS